MGAHAAEYRRLGGVTKSRQPPQAHKKTSCFRPSHVYPAIGSEHYNAYSTAVPIATSAADRNLMHWRGKTFSQVWADGVIWKLFNDIGTTNKYFVEFGTQDGSETNTRRLREECGWHGLLMDGGYENSSINLHAEFITRENIIDLFQKYQVPPVPDLVSLDIDGNEFHVLEAILQDSRWRPRVFIVEYVSFLPLSMDMVIKYNPSHRWDGTCYGSANARAYFNLARRYNYSLVLQMSPDLYFVRDSDLEASGLPAYEYTNDLENLKRQNLEAPFALWYLNCVIRSVGKKACQDPHHPPIEPLSMQAVDLYTTSCVRTWMRKGFNSSAGSLTKSLGRAQ